MDVKLLFFVLCAIYFVAIEGNSIRKISTQSKKCPECPPGWGTYKKCTQHSHTKCWKCVQGKTYSPYHSKSPCLPCSQCGIGLFESHKCTRIRDTICSDCLTYLDYKNLTIKNDFLQKCAYLFLK